MRSMPTWSGVAWNDRAEERKDPASDGRVFHFCAHASNDRVPAQCYDHDESSQGSGASYGFSP